MWLFFSFEVDKGGGKIAREKNEIKLSWAAHCEKINRTGSIV